MRGRGRRVLLGSTQTPPHSAPRLLIQHKPAPTPTLRQAMHFMPGCSVYKACRAAGDGPDAVAGAFTAAVGANPDVCRRLNLVATVCRHDEGMGRMAGCQSNFNSMCLTKGSVVPLCKAMAGMPELPGTKALNAVVSRWVGNDAR